MLLSLSSHIEKELKPLLEISKTLNLELRFVGGVTRDFLLFNNLVKDIDIEVAFHNQNLFEQNWSELSDYASKKFEVSKKVFNVITFNIGNYEIELTPIRKEIFNDNNDHKNFTAEFFNFLPIKESFLRRDFTINAIALIFYQEKFKIDDPFKGIKDIENGKLTFCHDETFIKDPVRFLRAFRFQAKYNLKLSKSLCKLLEQMNLDSLSNHYFFYELNKSVDLKFFLNATMAKMNFHLWIKSRGVLQAKERTFYQINKISELLVKNNQRIEYILPLTFSCNKDLVSSFNLNESIFDFCDQFEKFLNSVDHLLVEVLNIDSFNDAFNDYAFNTLFSFFNNFQRYEWGISLIKIFNYDNFKLVDDFKNFKFDSSNLTIDKSLINKFKFFHFIQDKLC